MIYADLALGSDAPLQGGVDPAISNRMRRVRRSGTHPEIVVRQVLTALGVRYRLHRAELPGTPDICFPSKKKVIFVHGCFWHRHRACRRATTPKTHVGYWKKKFRSNVRRDKRNIAELRRLGWTTLIVWECKCRQRKSLETALRRFLPATLGRRRRNRSAQTRTQALTLW
jgi:DNA mismatch endonuclease, patch repair protein